MQRSASGTGIDRRSFLVGAAAALLASGRGVVAAEEVKPLELPAPQTEVGKPLMPYGRTSTGRPWPRPWICAPISASRLSSRSATRSNSHTNALWDTGRRRRTTQRRTP